MTRILIILVAAGLFAGVSVAAERIPVTSQLAVELTLPEGWSLPSVPPAAMVEEMAEHLGHDAEAKGHHPSAEQLAAMARKHLAANEAIVYHAGSGANLTIDFSPLHADETPPGAGTIGKSAEYALQSLESEEGVSGLQSSRRSIAIPGADHAVRFDAFYRQHDEPVGFYGVIGYAPGQWFFLYFTNPGRDEAVARAGDQILASLKIVPR